MFAMKPTKLIYMVSFHIPNVRGMKQQEHVSRLRTAKASGLRELILFRNLVSCLMIRGLRDS